VIGVSGISPPAFPSFVGISSCIFVEPSIVSMWSLCYVIGLWIVLFFIVSLPVYAYFSTLCFLYFLLGSSAFVMSLLLLFVFPLLVLLESFIANWTSSFVRQYLIYNHSFSISLLAWIHILCIDDLKLAMFLYCSTTSGGIQVSTTFYWIYSRYVMNMLEFVFLSLAIVVCHNDSYCVVRHPLVLDRRKWCIWGSSNQLMQLI